MYNREGRSNESFPGLSAHERFRLHSISFLFPTCHEIVHIFFPLVCYIWRTRMYVYLHIIHVCIYVYGTWNRRVLKKKKSAAILLGTSTLYAPIEKRKKKKEKKGKRTEKYKNVEELNWKFGYRSFEPRFGSMSVKIIVFNLVLSTCYRQRDWVKKKKKREKKRETNRFDLLKIWL